MMTELKSLTDGQGRVNNNPESRANRSRNASRTATASREPESDDEYVESGENQEETADNIITAPSELKQEVVHCYFFICQCLAIQSDQSGIFANLVQEK